LLAGEGEIDELAPLARGTAVIAQLSPFADGGSHLAAYAEAGIDGYAMELMPRITRAQSMDVLSSQSNLAGYKAVLEACSHFGRAFPMMMTAAGTVPPAKVFVMGVGVAGLQAIATARRLGAQVSATDVRPATKEQVESLGGKFVAVEDEEFKQAETAGGYAKEMSAAYQAKQRAFVSDHIAKMDIVICTALIPGRPAPELVTPEQVASMKQGSVIYDLAAEQGGNCKAGRLGEVVEVNGVKIVSSYNLPSRIAVDASALYSRNLLTFLTGFYDKDAGAMKVDLADDIIKGILLTRAGAIIHPRFAPATAAE
jgi:H+-translocating NAD(P) transhydrogenase subunit alpha